MLGIYYDVDLHKMTQVNYDKKIVKIKAIIKTWGKRTLTAIGRNTIFKSLVIYQLNHPLLSLPNLCEATIKEIKQIMHNFIWETTIHKIKQDVSNQNNSQGDT